MNAVGCKIQDQPYDAQLAHKEQKLRELFHTYWDAPINVAPSPLVWRYRNKVDPVFARKFYPEPPPKDFVKESVIGYKKAGRWYWPLDIADCSIAPEGLGPLLTAVRAWMHREGLRACDTRTNQGFLKTLLVREGKRTGDKMVVLITAPGELNAPPFIQAVQSVWPEASIYHGTNQGRAEGAMMETVVCLAGSPHIHEKLHITVQNGTVRELLFRLSPMSFFQTNTLATEVLYHQLRCWVESIAPRILYDLYGGMGSIAFTCADIADEIWSVESVPEATQDGIWNASVNGISNVHFITEDVRKYTRELLADGPLPNDATVILDPPRAGMHPRAIKHLLELRPQNILYVSCKPSVFNTELTEWTTLYDIHQLKAVDLFPHTENVEVVAWLKAR